ncbi:MAG: Uma2 family endonuclease [Deltaproteobacteria bacterium]|nr:Uma2 family endonuclease [Deltaproteobacteria bacterium]
MTIVQHSEKERFSYADYLTWKDDQRWELINGEPLLMSPAPNRFHQTVSRKIEYQIESYLQGKSCEVFYAPFDVRLAEPETRTEDIVHVVQPDLLVVCDPSKLDTRGCLGAPDWIIEIISPSTASKDHIIKRELYERFGVTEYWIVQPLDRLVMVYQLNPDGRYGRSAVYSASDIITVGILPELQIDLKLVFKGIEEI